MRQNYIFYRHSLNNIINKTKNNYNKCEFKKTKTNNNIKEMWDYINNITKEGMNDGNSPKMIVNQKYILISDTSDMENLFNEYFSRSGKTLYEC